MRVSLCLVMLCMALGIPSLVSGQNPGAAASRVTTRVCLVDVAYIFDKHPILKQKIEAIDERAKSALDEIKKKQEVIMKGVEDLANFKEGSPEFKQREEALVNQESALKLEFNRKDKEFQEAKAKLIFETYGEVQAVIKAFADNNGIDLVMRFSREEMDPKKPATVQSGINRNIVYYNNQMDMTDHVLDYIIKNAPQQVAARPTNPAPAANVAPTNVNGGPNGAVPAVRSALPPNSNFQRK